MNLEMYTETLPDEEGKNWAVEGGNLYCFNFAVNSDQPLSEHYEQAREKVVKFCYRAIKKLGNPPGSMWTLTVIGEASATGSKTKNNDLARRRALMLAEYAVAEFDVYWQDKERNSLGPDYATPAPRLVPAYVILGDKVARTDPTFQHGIPASRVDDRQGEFRKVSFVFKAGRPSDALPIRTGQIRKVAGAEFVKKTTSLETLTDVGGAFFSLFSTVMKRFGESLLLDRIELVLKELGPLTTLGKHLVTFSVPSRVITGYQLRDGNRAPVVMKFEGTQHADSWDAMEFLEMIAVFDELIKVLGYLKPAKDAQKALANMALMTQTKSLLIRYTVELIRAVFGEDASRSWAVILNNFDAFQKGTVVAASKWGTFTYHRRAPDKRVQELGGIAKRFIAGSLWSAHETLQFGGPVANNWTEFNAQADVFSFDPFSNGILHGSWSEGVMTPLGNRKVLEV
jgi:hypothetical protein